jgi:S1-C subfamily serine protease
VCMTNASDSLTSFSNSLADAVAAAAPSVVQVHGARRPATGVIYRGDIVVTTARALGREDGLHVRRADGTTLDAELAGFDPATGLAVLRVPGLDGTPIERAPAEPRVGHLALAVARSWSNAVTASAGIVAVIGGPLPTGRRRSIAQVIRTTAPMHDGFAGGAFLDTSGALLGIATSMAIRGTGVVIPAGIAWDAAAAILEHGQVKRGYLGIAGQPARLPEKHRTPERETALLVVGLTSGGPADSAGILVGDLVLRVDEQPIASPQDLLDLLSSTPPGRTLQLDVLRGGTPASVPIVVGERLTS